MFSPFPHFLSSWRWCRGREPHHHVWLVPPLSRPNGLSSIAYPISRQRCICSVRDCEGQRKRFSRFQTQKSPTFLWAADWYGSSGGRRSVHRLRQNVWLTYCCRLFLAAPFIPLKMQTNALPLTWRRLSEVRWITARSMKPWVKYRLLLVIHHLRNKSFAFCWNCIFFINPTSSPDCFVILMKYEACPAKTQEADCLYLQPDDRHL